MVDQTVVMVEEVLIFIRDRNSVSFEVNGYIELILQVEISRGVAFVICFHFCFLRGNFIY